MPKQKGYEFVSKLEISMQYYTFESDDESKYLCTILTPFGKYRYNRMPMGLKWSADFAQEVLENIFRHLEDTDIYIDDVEVFSTSWTSHIKLLNEILRLL